MIVGVDVGGTFTDFVLVDPATGSHRYHKVPSTPHDPAEAVLTGLEQLGVAGSALDRVVHGTTVATNTVLQRSGARTGLITSPGHRDMLLIRRGNKPETEVFNPLWEEPAPLAVRHLSVDVDERTDHRGREIRPLARDELELAVDHLVAHDVEAVAVCFLFSYLDPTHERQAADLIRARHPHLHVSLSSEILPQWREYERAVTTVTDAYVKPRMVDYLNELTAALGTQGFERDLLIMKSNGGVMTSAMAASRPVETFLSGPAGGVVAGLYAGRQVGLDDLITIDMGGTSFEASLVTGGQLSTTTANRIDDVTPLNIAMLDIRTIGAGGGSIAWIDPGGGLQVGPRSAGAAPGPACYGTGGTEPTVTDANVVLGRVGVRTLLGGRVAIDAELAHSAVAERVARPLGLDTVVAAAGVIRVTVANMVGALRAITAERGVDPRDYALLSGGGGGPLHAALIAREAGIARVVVPSYPGLLSAGGLVLSDLKVDIVRSFPGRLERDGVEQLRAVVVDTLVEAVGGLTREGYRATPVTTVELEMRYLGQNWEIAVPVDPDNLSVAAVCAAFDERHDRLYGFALPESTHEVLAVRVGAIGPNREAKDLVPTRFRPGAAVPPAPLADPIEVREVWDDTADDFVPAPILDRDRLRPGNELAGPVVVEGNDSAVWVPNDCTATVDSYGNLVIELGA